MANRLVSVDENYLFPTPLEARLAAKMTASVTDDAVASQINGTQTGPAIDHRIGIQVAPVVDQLVADAIADDQTIVDAAAAAVNANPKIASLEDKNASQDTAIAAAAWYKGDVPLGLNLNDHKEIGTRQARTSSIVASMVGMPAGSTTDPLRITVAQISTTNGIFSQTIEQYSPDGVISWERLSLSGVYQAFKKVEKSWYRGSLKSSTNLSTWFEVGIRSAGTSSLVSTLVGRPEDSNTEPMDVEVKELSSTNGIYLQTIRQWSSSGVLTWQRLSLSKVYGSFEKLTQDRRWSYGVDVHVFGDSLVEQGFPNFMTGMAGNVVNRGRSGDTSNDALLRAGIIKMFGVPVGGEVPASGTIDINVLGRKLTTRNDRTFVVWWAGIAGTLKHVSNDAWTFTRHNAGVATPIAEPTPFVSAQELPAGVVAGFFFGTNDIWHLGAAPETNVADHIVANYHRAVEAVPATPERRALVFGSITTRSTVADDSLHQLVKQVNGQLRSSMPHRFVSMQEYMTTQAMGDLGLTPTASESNAMAAGLIPESLYVDNLHLTQEAQEAFAVNVVKPTYQARGWA